MVADARGADRHLRITWHPDAGQFNVSTWHGDVCAGAVRVEADQAPRIIALLADGMGDAIAVEPPVVEPDPARPGAPRWRTWLERQLRRVS